MSPPKAPAPRAAPKASPKAPPGAEIGVEISGGFSHPVVTKQPEFSKSISTAPNLEALAGTTTATIPPGFEATILSITPPAANPEGAHAALEDIAAGEPLETALQKAMRGDTAVDRSGEGVKTSVYAKGVDLSHVEPLETAPPTAPPAEATAARSRAAEEPPSQAAPPEAGSTDTGAAASEATAQPHTERADQLSERTRSQLNTVLQGVANELASGKITAETASDIIAIGFIRTLRTTAGAELSRLSLEEMLAKNMIPQAQVPIVRQAINEYQTALGDTHPLREAIDRAHVLTEAEAAKLGENPSNAALMGVVAEKLTTAFVSGDVTEANLLLNELTGGQVMELRGLAALRASGISPENALRVAQAIEELQEEDPEDWRARLLQKSGLATILILFVMMTMGPGALQQAEK